MPTVLCPVCKQPATLPDPWTDPDYACPHCHVVVDLGRGWARPARRPGFWTNRRRGIAVFACIGFVYAVTDHEDPAPRPKTEQQQKREHITDENAGLPAPGGVKIGPTPENLKGADELYEPGDVVVVVADKPLTAWAGHAKWEAGANTGAARTGKGDGLLQLTPGTKLAVIDPALQHLAGRVLGGDLDGRVVYLDMRDFRQPWVKALRIESQPAKRTQSRAQKALREKLAELDAFRGTPEFMEWGFAVAGPYNGWLKEVKGWYHDKTPAEDGGPTSTETIAFGHLMQLGMDYMHKKNAESDHTRYARRVIGEAIGEGPAVPKND